MGYVVHHHQGVSVFVGLELDEQSQGLNIVIDDDGVPKLFPKNLEQVYLHNPLLFLVIESSRYDLEFIKANLLLVEFIISLNCPRTLKNLLILSELIAIKDIHIPQQHRYSHFFVIAVVISD
jgi:hypothetical protein